MTTAIDPSDYRFVYQHFRFPANWRDIIYSDSIVGRHGEAFHFRRSISGWVPTPRGGYTKCYVYNGGQLVITGLAECSPKDSFCYALGRNISRGRALKELKRMLKERNESNPVLHH